MNTSVSKNNWFAAAGLLLALPAAYLILVSVLKYGLGIDGPFDAIQPLAERWGIKDPPGLNITSVVLFGPVLAIVLAIIQVLKIEWHFSKEEFLLHVSVRKRWFPLLVTAFGAGLLAILFFYQLAENCNC